MKVGRHSSGQRRCSQDTQAVNTDHAQGQFGLRDRPRQHPQPNDTEADRGTGGEYDS